MSESNFPDDGVLPDGKMKEMITETVRHGLMHRIADVATEEARKKIAKAVGEYIKNEILPEIMSELKKHKKEIVDNARKEYAKFPSLVVKTITSQLKSTIKWDLDDLIKAFWGYPDDDE